ncbi:LysR family transcriptional regulator [Nocardioidaceae bacterium]|nr:LysR family transcriptional regulator [Nocardioidaceae bacterium]
MTEARPALTDLALLLTVVREGSMGRAADRLGASQPAVSRRVAALERELGVGLVERTPRGSVLTAQGRVVADWAAELLEHADHFSRLVATLRADGGEALRIAVSVTIAEHLAPAWVARLRAEAPDVQVAMAVGNSEDVVGRVRRAEVDLGFVESPRIPEGLAHRRVGSDRLMVAVAPTHPWAGRAAPVGPGELAYAGLLLRESGSGTRETLDAALAAHGQAAVRPTVMASNAALRAAALAGAGPVALSERVLARAVEGGELVAVPTVDLDLTRPFSAVWRRGSRPGHTASRLLEVVLGGS